MEYRTLEAKVTIQVQVSEINATEVKCLKFTDWRCSFLIIHLSCYITYTLISVIFQRRASSYLFRNKMYK